MSTLSRALAATLALAVMACSPPATTSPEEEQVINEFRAALPDTDVLHLRAPGQASGALSVGKLSPLYTTSAATMKSVNLVLWSILGPITHTVKGGNPTFEQENRAVWYYASPLGPLAHVLVLDRKEDGHFEYVVASRPKGGADDAWTPVIGGSYTPTSKLRRGHGTVWINLDKDRAERTVGKVMALWSNVGNERTVTVYFFGASVDTTQAAPINAAFHYQEAEDRSGTFVYGVNGVDIHGGQPGKEALENAAIISRWDSTGSGRADLHAAGGDLETDGFEHGVLSECWTPESFVVAYTSLVLKPEGGKAVLAQSEGDHALCAFDDIGIPVFPDPQPEPVDPPLPDEAR